MRKINRKAHATQPRKGQTHDVPDRRGTTKESRVDGGQGLEKSNGRHAQTTANKERLDTLCTDRRGTTKEKQSATWKQLAAWMGVIPHRRGEQPSKSKVPHLKMEFEDRKTNGGEYWW